MWGLSRTLVANMVTGVTKGYEPKLELVGVGYRAAMKGKDLQMQLGFSHDVDLSGPGGHHLRRAEADRNHESPASTSSRSARPPPEIRAFRPPEPYKGKGVRYAGEFIRRKEGKKK